MEDGRRVVIRPRRPDYPGKGMVSQERSQLVATVHDVFEEARHRLRREEAPAGFYSCIGLLDPVSNIAVNAVTISGDGNGEDDLERRSVDGMVVFLTTFFPYMTDWEAVHYLLLAHAHLLGAACLVLKDRAMETSPAGHVVDSMLRTALKCAAVAARHSDPDRLVSAWLSLSARQLDHIVAGDLSTVRLGELSGGPGKKPWELAASRQQQQLLVEGDVPYYYHTRSLRRALLDKVHRHNLRALARLPRRELRRRYHRALLAGGGCYGPLDDPASNVVLNIVWYDATSPPARRDGAEEAVDMIGTDALGRAANRSVYGILSFLCTRYDGLSEHDAVRCLLDADADVHAAARDAERRGHRQRAGTTLQEAYAAAATAAGHPDANAQAAFLAQALALENPLESPEDVLRLAELLSPAPRPEPAAPEPATKLYWAIIRDRRRQFRAEQARIAGKVKAALEQYAAAAAQNKTTTYELHVICGVNEDVSGPEEIPRSHINFLATDSGGGGEPVLFFAECRNDDDEDDEVPLCVPVGVPAARAPLVRCMYCDGIGGKMVHPASPEFHFQGRNKEFEAAARGGGKQVRQLHRNDYIIQSSEYHAQRMCGLQEDCIYLDSDGASSDDDQDLLSMCEFNA
uniref:Uncharacterized protein n=1 Tax=Avena sativa TaxID=4498 RepID=A0ACD5ZNY0_AVESA